MIDWAEAAPGLYLFCAVLAFSRWRFVRVRHRSEAIHHVGVDRRSLRRDRRGPGQGAGRPDGLPEGWCGRNVVVPTAEYVRLAAHYGFAPDFCHADDPAIERASWRTCAATPRRDLAVPLLTEAAIARRQR